MALETKTVLEIFPDVFFLYSFKNPKTILKAVTQIYYILYNPKST